MPGDRQPSCREVTQLLIDYVDGTMAPDLRAELTSHMADCPPCLAFMRTYRETIRLSRELRCDDMPEAVRVRLESFLEGLRREGLRRD